MQDVRLHACFRERLGRSEGKAELFFAPSSMDCAEHDFGCASLQGPGAAEPEPNFTPLQCLTSLDFWLLVFACIIGTPDLQPVWMLCDFTSSSRHVNLHKFCVL